MSTGTRPVTSCVQHFYSVLWGAMSRNCKRLLYPMSPYSALCYIKYPPFGDYEYTVSRTPLQGVQ
eukprot:13200356-Ditylum_brightwellii.AAC.1